MHVHWSKGAVDVGSLPAWLATMLNIVDEELAEVPPDSGPPGAVRMDMPPEQKAELIRKGALPKDA